MSVVRLTWHIVKCRRWHWFAGWTWNSTFIWRFHISIKETKNKKNTQSCDALLSLCNNRNYRNLTVECTHSFPNPMDRCSFANWCWPIDGSPIEDVTQLRHHHVHMYRMPSNKWSQCHDAIALAYVMYVIDTSFCSFLFFCSFRLIFFIFQLFADDYRRRFSEFNTQLQNKTKQKIENHQYILCTYIGNGNAKQMTPSHTKSHKNSKNT